MFVKYVQTLSPFSPTQIGTEGVGGECEFNFNSRDMWISSILVHESYDILILWDSGSDKTFLPKLAAAR